uniref:Uncharacterized protein n=1 Tax=Ditylenchus dipsaci TaxID=166011 RepID=A0A915CRB6_9BILA
MWLAHLSCLSAAPPPSPIQQVKCYCYWTSTAQQEQQQRVVALGLMVYNDNNTTTRNGTAAATTAPPQIKCEEQEGEKEERKGKQ